jgi:hypothetical protein
VTAKETAMHAATKRLTVAASDLIARFPWGGWIGWLIFCAIALARTAPRRFASTFTYYIEAAERLLAHGQVYDQHSLGAFLYFPISLLVYAPFTAINPSVAAGFWQAVFAAVFTWGCYVLTMRLLPQGAGNLKAPWLAGMVLLINVPAAWFNFKGVQSQIIMTGAMLIAAAAIMRAQWLWATFWLFIALVFKPLAVVMALLCAVLCPRMRLPLLVALGVLAALPFVFFDAGYLIEQYRDLGIKLWLIATAPAQDWPYRADLSTLLRAVGIVMPSTVSLAVRLIAALGTLYLAWRVRGTNSARSFGFALVILSACYINLLSPRNEFLSFLVLTPSLAVLAFLVLARDQGDWRGWALIFAALVLGMWWSLAFDAVAKPAIVIMISGWLAWLMVKPERWREVVETAGSTAALDPLHAPATDRE